MPNTFTSWQSRTGLVRAADAAAALGLTLRSVQQLRRGDREPSGAVLRLMEVLDAHPELIGQLPPPASARPA